MYMYVHVLVVRTYSIVWLVGISARFFTSPSGQVVPFYAHISLNPMYEYGDISASRIVHKYHMYEVRTHVRKVRFGKFYVI